MLARVIPSLRSRPGRTAALALVVLLVLGAAVAAFSDGPGTVAGDEAAGRQLPSGANGADTQAPLSARTVEGLS
ncbi:MAG: hypothetical protein ACRD0O_05885, partial [Acidimicrobiia bacterium]